jgi:hypothetical protein
MTIVRLWSYRFEIRVPETTPAQVVKGRRHAARVETSLIACRLNENIGNSDQELWDMIA